MTDFEALAVLIAGVVLPTLAYLIVRGSSAASGPVRWHSLGTVIVSGAAISGLAVLMI